MKNLISIDQLAVDELEDIFFSMVNYQYYYSLLTGRKTLKSLHFGKRICLLFKEPSTRTRFSFEAAAQMLGVDVIGSSNPEELSFAKGESFEDTIRIISGYADALVLRTSIAEQVIQAPNFSKVPIINAGNGSDEHPTQAILDLYTISQITGSINDHTITLVGDLEHGRAARSFAKILTKYKPKKVIFLSYPGHRLDSKIIQSFQNNQISYQEEDILDYYPDTVKDIYSVSDVVYLTRLQRERAIDSPEFFSPILNRDNIKALKPNAIVLHPMPITDEIERGLEDPRFKFIQQARFGLFARAAILDRILKDGVL